MLYPLISQTNPKGENLDAIAKSLSLSPTSNLYTKAANDVASGHTGGHDDSESSGAEELDGGEDTFPLDLDFSNLASPKHTSAFDDSPDGRGKDNSDSDRSLRQIASRKERNTPNKAKDDDGEDKSDTSSASGLAGLLAGYLSSDSDSSCSPEKKNKTKCSSLDDGKKDGNTESSKSNRSQLTTVPDDTDKENGSDSRRTSASKGHNPEVSCRSVQNNNCIVQYKSDICLLPLLLLPFLLNSQKLMKGKT